MAATITPTPMTFWSVGGDVLMRVPGGRPMALAETSIADLLDVMNDEMEAADAAGAKVVWADLVVRHCQLLEALHTARCWARAAGDIPRAA
ncbi:hypothetical protein [Caulobacter sp. RHG1]|uniref:hypothetical protein n=1 Tax=Caulobacter sp. (strain RHG1) TaxID=2545762 RepID=UPI001552AA25|nr:hypothetical protein [Caulobacter sp. RHG1]NQE62915.1 hypothetical protein [Caulobacter sp. RHG1]